MRAYSLITFPECLDSILQSTHTLIFILILDPGCGIISCHRLFPPSHYPSHYPLHVTTLISTCNHNLPSPQSLPSLPSTPTPVGMPSPTAPPHPTPPSSTASYPPKSTAAPPAPPALPEEPTSSTTTQKPKPSTTVSGRARGVSRMTPPSSGREKRSSHGR